jgi:hypothetical protein
MRARNRTVTTALAGAGLVGATVLSVASAQDMPNPALTFSYTSSLTTNDNLGLDPTSAGNSTWLDNRLGLSYSTETATSSLTFGASGVIRLSKLAGQDSDAGFDDGTLNLAYSRQGANSLFSLGANYNRTDVAFFDPLRLIPDPDNPVDPGDLTASAEGSRESRQASVKFATGLEGPFGMNFAASHSERLFHDTTDPDLYDTTRSSLSVGATLRPVARTALTFNISQTDYSAEDIELTDRITRRAVIGLSHALTDATMLTASIGQTWIEKDQTIGLGRVQTEQSGLNGSLALSHDLANGTVGVSLNHDISTDGNARTDLLLTRNMDLPNGNLALSIGPSFQSGGKNGLAGTLSYGHNLPQGSLRANVSRRFASNDQDDAIDTTRLSLGWNHELSANSGLDLSLDYMNIDSDAVGADRERARLQLAYTMDLVNDWQLSGGYAHTYSDKEGTGTAKSNSIFVSIGRSVSFAP